MQEWYLMKTPTLTSGDESDLLDEFGEDALLELLASGVAEDVEILNYDLSLHKETKAIIQGNAQDTKLNSLNRRMIVPIGTCQAGQYVKRDGRYWLIIGFVDSNVIYDKAVLILCNYYLTWVNDKGNIVQRWANITSASQYNNGETNMNYYFVRTDQLMILTPNDEECLMLDSGTRFVIDKRCQIYESKFDDTVAINTDNPLYVYTLTRSDTVLYDYQDSGHYEFLATQDEQRETDGYYLINGNGYWLANMPQGTTMNTVSACRIVAVQDTVYIGVEPATYRAEFYDDSGAIITDITPEWSITCDFADELTIEYVDDTILISSDNSDTQNKSFTLTLSADGYEPASIEVLIKILF